MPLSGQRYGQCRSLETIGGADCGDLGGSSDLSVGGRFSAGCARLGRQIGGPLGAGPERDAGSHVGSCPGAPVEPSHPLLCGATKLKKLLTGSFPRWYDCAQFIGDNDVSTSFTEALVSGQ